MHESQYLQNYKFKKVQRMKSFKFSEMDRKFSKESEKSVKEEVETNFLKLYEDIPPDPRIDQFCKITTAQFDQKTINNRYYSYDLEKGTRKTEREKYRVKQIKGMLNFQLGFQPSLSPTKAKFHQRQDENVKKKRKRELRKKFRKNIKLIIAKLQKLQISMDEIIKYNVFERVPYKFGKEIFMAVKQGNEEKVWSTLMINKLAIFSLDHTFKTPLIWSCIRGFHKITILLLQDGIDPSKTDLNGYDALYYAIKYNQPECLKALALNMSPIEQVHHEQIKKAELATRQMFNLCLSLMELFNRFNKDKREEILNEQFKSLYRK